MEEVLVVAGVVTVVAGEDPARNLRVGSRSGPTRSFLPLVWGLVPPGVIETPFHHLGAAKFHLHRLIHCFFFSHVLVEYEIGNQRAAHPVTAPAMTEDGSFSCASKHRQDSVKRVVIQSACSDRYVDVLHAELPHYCGLIHRAGLHRVPQIQHDARTCLLQGAKLLSIGLTAGDDIGQDLTGVGDAMQGMKQIGHSLKVRSQS